MPGIETDPIDFGGALVLVARELRNTLESPNEYDVLGNDPANVVDGLFAISRGLTAIADAVAFRTVENMSK